MRWRAAKRAMRLRDRRFGVCKGGRAESTYARIASHQHDRVLARASLANSEWWGRYERPTWAEGARRLELYSALRRAGRGRFGALAEVRRVGRK